MYTVVLLAAMTAGPTSTGQGFSKACSGCRGCYGCWGGFSGSGYNYMVGHGYQSSFSVYAPVVGGTYAHGGGGGAFGCYGCNGGTLPVRGTLNESAPVVPAPTPTPAPEKTTPKLEESPPPKEEKRKDLKTDDQVRARLTIDAPADAKIFLDGELLSSASARRAFMTPVLVPGHIYYYDLKVEVVRAGQTIAETQRVVLQPGQLATARFPNLNQGAAEVPVASRHD